MAELVQITVFRSEDGTPSVRFDADGLEQYVLVFSGRGDVTLYVPDTPQGKLKCFGQALIVSRYLGIDFTQIEIQTIRQSTITTDDAQASLSMIRALKRLCNAVNTFFTERAVFYWDIPPADCYLKDGHVCTANHRIAYHQLLEIDAAIYQETRKVA